MSAVFRDHKIATVTEIAKQHYSVTPRKFPTSQPTKRRTTMTQIAIALSKQNLIATVAAAIGALLPAAPGMSQTAPPSASEASRPLLVHVPKRNFTMSRLKISLVFLAFSASFAPLASSARGLVTPPNQPTQQLVQISGPTTPSPFGAGRAGEFPGYSSHIHGGVAIYALMDETDRQELFISLSN
jgi:hypothetical protein